MLGFKYLIWKYVYHVGYCMGNVIDLCNRFSHVNVRDKSFRSFRNAVQQCYAKESFDPMQTLQCL